MSYYDRKGKPITLMEWAQALKSDDARRVLKTDITPNVFVSTVWLGLDHSFGQGPPLIFESVVFENGEGGDMDRYATEEEAREGHAAMVAAQIKRVGH